MLLLSYADQLRMLAAEEGVDLLDAIKQAGVPNSTYYRSISRRPFNGKTRLREDTAEAIALAIKELSAR